jgi:sterol desaturase/sphingolipid hydroxylase (fatty acid hydroxylase superfamily)
MQAVRPYSQPAPRTAQRWTGLHPKPNRISTMSLVSLVVTLIVVGILLWLVNTYLPMDRKIKTILNVVVVIFVILWILNGTGLLGGLNGITVGG